MRHVSDTSSSSLYRRSLKLALDWAVHRYIWRGQAMYIRGLFEANKHVTEPRQQKVRASAKEKEHNRSVIAGGDIVENEDGTMSAC